MVMTRKLADHLEMAEIKMFASRLRAIEGLQHNAIGVEIGQFDGAYAFSIKSIPGPSYNVVKGDSLQSEHLVETILAFYKEKGIPARFDVAPQYMNASSLQKLHHAGFFQSDFHTTLYSALSSEYVGELKNSIIEIRTIQEDEFDFYGKLYVEGFNMPRFLADSVAANNKVLYDKPGWSFYIASLNNEDVGIGSMFVHNSTAILAASAVQHSARNKGIHQALIQYRVKEAVKQNCKHVVGHAKFASTSQKNMERCGMTIAYTKSIWTEVN
ncbi:GNAT family N-acetyltransferase [Lysinibacillus cavernae]|uniref:GNAT family N-acetyltransferase n=1 Tax=Lysinibacillus cavernae TaxID=2666135 RepID=UPI0012D88ECB|nr:GNAT family N-acetyltransferase [Lysinibacillus cavernae]